MLEDDREIDFWIGNNNVSKAEDVLEQVSDILENNGIKKIDLIAVSDGPGSSTGIRIGLATALGLRKSFNCEIVRVSVFEAILFNKRFYQPLVVAIPVGSRQIAWQVFEKDVLCQKHQIAEYGNIKVFPKPSNSQSFTKIILHSELIEVILSADKKIEAGRIEIMDDNIAALIGLRGKQIIAEKYKTDFCASDNA